MNGRIQIYTDEHGKKSSVMVPYEWANLKSRVKTLENKLKVFSSIQSGMREVKEARSTGRKLESLSDFIDASRD